MTQSGFDSRKNKVKLSLCRINLFINLLLTGRLNCPNRSISRLTRPNHSTSDKLFAATQLGFD